MESEQGKASFFQQVGGLPKNFWCANVIEMLERLAFFGVRAMVGLYIVAPGAKNGLELDYAQKGWIFGIWALLQCLIPMVSGGFTDRYGYKKSLAVAFVINIAGYLLMAQSKSLADQLLAAGLTDAGFWVFLFAACMVGTGTAIFKPPIAATVARTTTEETSSLGWGLFYWVVNIGAAIAPVGAASLRGEVNWNVVFYAAALVTLVNFIPAFVFYKEPERPKSADQQEQGPIEVFCSSIANMFSDARLLAFLLISACFWVMFMQLWDQLPNFIDEWINTSDVRGFFGAINSEWITSAGQVKPEMIINIDALAIVLFVVPLSWLIRRLNKVVAMVAGMIIALIGFVGAGITTMGWVCCLMIFIFAVGEMTCSPTFNAYIGLIAPKGKKALYMGYSNMPFAIGWTVGNFLSGYIYENVSNKFRIAREYMIEKFGLDPEFAMSDKLLPKDQVMPAFLHLRDGGDPVQLQQAMTEVHNTVTAQALNIDATQDALNAGYTGVLGEVDHAAIRDVTNMLWDMYDPWMVWIYLGIIGLIGTIGMIVFYFVTRKALAAQAAEKAAAKLNEP